MLDGGSMVSGKLSDKCIPWYGLLTRTHLGRRASVPSPSYIKRLLLRRRIARTSFDQPEVHSNDWERAACPVSLGSAIRTGSVTCLLGDIWCHRVIGKLNGLVNAANKQLLGGGGVDGAIHRAAGPELLDACRKVPEVRRGVRCPTGEARITPAFRLPVFYVIHTVGPIYDEDEHPEVSLSNAFRNSLKLAKENNIQYIAFPAISCGVYRYPFKEASRIAISVLKEFPDTFKEIHFVLFSDELYGVWLQTASEETG
ncbi:hypothetical protein ZIOFF_016108 [Zingiber officinale]|uniref:Macro domain-containing protein n=1 Tax=Zingiber officinale TaxID=94328 RepID=A0A8J5HDW6_ZINOF|nr:hypothetical protein ZIOFF_016108 [Zingiber officinale]